MSEDIIEFCPLTREDCQETCGWWDCHSDRCSMLAISTVLLDIFGLIEDMTEDTRIKA
jgi:hypothetical protein